MAIEDRFTGNTPFAIRKRKQKSKQRKQGGIGSTSTQADVTDASGVGVVKAKEPIQKLGLTDTPAPTAPTQIGALQGRIDALNTTREQINSGGPATFNFTNKDGTGKGSFSTSDPEGASRVALGEGIRGGTVSTINIQNVIESNRLTQARKTVASLRSQGASARAQSEAFKRITNPDRSQAQKQLENINDKAADGVINAEEAIGLRFKAGQALGVEQKLKNESEQATARLGQQADQFNRTTSISEANATTARARLEASNRKFLGQERTRQSKSVSKRNQDIFSQLRDPENAISIADASTLSDNKTAMRLSEEGNSAINASKAAIRAAKDPASKQAAFNAFIQTAQSFNLDLSAEDASELLNS